MNKIIAFVGMPGSGKGTCTDYMASKGYPVVHFGNMVYDEVKRRGLDNFKDEKFVRKDMRDKEGKEVLAKRASQKADELFGQGQKLVIFDGLYSWSELKYLRQKYGEHIVVIALVAPRQERYQRILNRKDSHRKYESVQQIIDREISEIEDLEKGGPIAHADYYLCNSSSMDDLRLDLEKLLVSLSE